MRFVAPLLLVLAACIPKPIPTPPVTPTAPYCVNPADIRQSGECEGRFTDEGRPCAVCGGASACVDRMSGLYCVTRVCEDDPACRSEPNKFGVKR